MAPHITTIYVFCPDVVVLYASFFSGSCLSVIHCIFYSHSFLVYVLYRVPNSVPTVLHASSILGPNSRFGIRIRSIVFPCTFSILLTSVSTYNLNCAHVPSFSTSEGAAGIQIKKGDCWKSFEILQKCNFKMCFLLIETRCCVQPCVSSCSSGSKKAQNWGFEITNVRYGHQGSFCRHFNDGSNSCFQTTNWNAAHGEWRRTFRNILN